MATANSPCMNEKIFQFISEESSQKGLLFQPRPSDVIIVTPPKCGTTWMQQITHQLRTGGDMDFDEIIDVVPWIELAFDMHRDLEAEQKATPRLFKSHLPRNCCPKGGRYIVMYRNPCSTAYSFYKFMVGIALPDTVSADEYITESWLKLGDPENKAKPLDVSYFTHLLGWMAHKNDPNVLILFFEEMKEDRDAVVRAVASFLGIQDEENIRNAVEKSSFEFMKANGRKFDESVISTGLATPIHIRTGSADEALKVLTENVQAVVQKRWEKEITKVTGYKTYEELRLAFRKERPLAK